MSSFRRKIALLVLGLVASGCANQGLPAEQVPTLMSLPTATPTSEPSATNTATATIPASETPTATRTASPSPSPRPPTATDVSPTPTSTTVQPAVNATESAATFPPAPVQTNVASPMPLSTISAPTLVLPTLTPDPLVTIVPTPSPIGGFAALQYQGSANETISAVELPAGVYSFRVTTTGTLTGTLENTNGSCGVGSLSFLSPTVFNLAAGEASASFEVLVISNVCTTDFVLSNVTAPWTLEIRQVGIPTS